MCQRRITYEKWLYIGDERRTGANKTQATKDDTRVANDVGSIWQTGRELTTLSKAPH